MPLELLVARSFFQFEPRPFTKLVPSIDMLHAYIAP